MDSDIVGSILLQVVLIAVNAVFACAEIAVVSCNDAKLEKMAQEGNKRAAKLFHLTEQPSRFLATIQVVITLSGFLGSAFAAENFSEIKRAFARKTIYKSARIFLLQTFLYQKRPFCIQAFHIFLYPAFLSPFII